MPPMDRAPHELSQALAYEGIHGPLEHYARSGRFTVEAALPVAGMSSAMAMTR